MHIFFVGEEIPFNGESGSCIHGWAMIQYFLSAGHKVTAIVNPPGWESEYRDEHIKNLSSIGVRVVSLYNVAPVRPKRLRLLRILNPKIKDYYHTVVYKQEISNVIEKCIDKLRPHIIVAFGLPAICVTQGIKTVPRIAPICEDPFILILGMLRYGTSFMGGVGFLRKYCKYFVNLVNSHRVLKQIIKVYTECQVYGQVAINYVETFRKLGASGCKYYKSPYIDTIGKDWKELKERAQAKNKKTKIIMIGKVSTPTYLHYKILTDNILLRIDEKLGKDTYEIHLIGRVTIPPEYKKGLNHPSIILRGYVNDIKEDFLSADILLVPTPINLGIRSRIIVGLSYGCCIVTTIFEKDGRPELNHMENCLIANSVQEIPELIIMALNDKQLRKKIEYNARMTYEKNFMPQVAIQEMEDDMKSIIRNFQYSHDYFIS
ncbi:MAG: glycosyltransferase [Planctomycetes bacterium]|nr:glycosyltransferase [Planctomycetota bacterium]